MRALRAQTEVQSSLRLGGRATLEEMKAGETMARFVLLGSCAAVLLGLGCSLSSKSSDASASVKRDGSAGSADCSLPPPGSLGTAGCSCDCSYFLCSGGTWQRVSMLLCIHRCGDGVLYMGEECDDGNAVAGDGCSGGCQIEANWICPTAGSPCTKTSRCGDGVVTSDEICDDGNTVSGDGCSADCQQIETGWECRVPGQACTPICYDGKLVHGACVALTCPSMEPGTGSRCDGGAPEPSVCGDGVVGPDEQCDDGSDPTRTPYNDGSYGGCTTNCLFGPWCGDGMVNGREECDDGGLNGAGYGQVGCTFACTVPHYCGDGILDIDHGEECDLGPLNSQRGQLCLNNCKLIIF